MEASTISPEEEERVKFYSPNENTALILATKEANDLAARASVCDMYYSRMRYIPRITHVVEQHGIGAILLEIWWGGLEVLSSDLNSRFELTNNCAPPSSSAASNNTIPTLRPIYPLIPRLLFPLLPFGRVTVYEIDDAIDDGQHRIFDVLVSFQHNMHVGLP